MNVNVYYERTMKHIVLQYDLTFMCIPYKWFEGLGGSTVKELQNVVIIGGNIEFPALGLKFNIIDVLHNKYGSDSWMDKLNGKVLDFPETEPL